VVLKFRSVNNIVIAPANTGSLNNNKIAVRNTDQTKSDNNSMGSVSGFILITVVIKLAEPKILETPARCKAKIPKSTDNPGWPKDLNGGYTVQPVPAPVSTRPLIRSIVRAGGRSQNLILFIRGKAISGALSIIGTNQLPKPPIIVGITKKKIIIKA